MSLRRGKMLIEWKSMSNFAIFSKNGLPDLSVTSRGRSKKTKGRVNSQCQKVKGQGQNNRKVTPMKTLLKA